MKREKPDFRCFVSSLTIVRRASTEKKKKEEEEESNARKTMLHFSTLEIDPIRLKFQSSKKGEPLSIAKYLQCRSNCNWRHISPLYYDTLSLSRKKLIPSEARQRVFPRPPPVFLVRSHIYHAIYAATVPTFATLVPRHARFICIFIPVSLLCAYTKRAYTPISYQFRGNQKAPGCFPAAPTFKHNLERSNAINLKREGNGGLFSGVLRP